MNPLSYSNNSGLIPQNNNIIPLIQFTGEKEKGQDFKSKKQGVKVKWSYSGVVLLISEKRLISSNKFGDKLKKH